MYLSRIKLNTACTDTMRAMAAPSVFHGAIESSDEKRIRKLWRTDTLGGEQYLLVLSEVLFDLSKVARQFGYDDSYESKSYDGLLRRITNGSKWQFRLRANPTYQMFDEKKGRGKICAHKTIEYQKQWLIKQSQKYGFELSENEWLVTESKWYMFNKKHNSKNTVKMLAVTYEGTLTVSDVELFREAMKNGIGREKAYGMGLLTIMSVK